MGRLRCAQKAVRRDAKRDGRDARAPRAVLLLAVILIATASLRAADMFPFVLPWDDATPSITDLSAWNDAPAGKDGFVVVKNGHLPIPDKPGWGYEVNQEAFAHYPPKPWHRGFAFGADGAPGYI